MRLFAKFFICASLVICAAVLLSGYLLITASHESAISRELDRAVTQYQFDKFTVQAGLIANQQIMQAGNYAAEAFFRRLSADVNAHTAFFTSDKTILYSDLSESTDFSILDTVTGNTHIYMFQTVDEISYITVAGKIFQSDIEIYFLTATDISAVIAHRDYMMRSFFYVYILTLSVSLIVILIMVSIFIRPIKRMSTAAAEIAMGRYDERLPESSGDEIGDLSKSFNLMADAVEDKIAQLSKNARQKEDFVANFAHELKTPLTSVIGYADMLYQKKLTPEQTKDAAGYILSEGLRLEALSLKLMDLIVLGRHNFVLEEMDTTEMMENITIGLKPVLLEKSVEFKLNIQLAYVMVEYDLFKTLILNLIDNGIKAGGRNIKLSGASRGNSYIVSVSDDGKGIADSELSRITEAFYMVDKSRTKKEHGAGLGLALAVKIAEIHGSKLEINSIEAIGTTVEIRLKMPKL